MEELERLCLVPVWVPSRPNIQNAACCDVQLYESTVHGTFQQQSSSHWRTELKPPINYCCFHSSKCGAMCRKAKWFCGFVSIAFSCSVSLCRFVSVAFSCSISVCGFVSVAFQAAAVKTRLCFKRIYYHIILVFCSQVCMFVAGYMKQPQTCHTWGPVASAQLNGQNVSDNLNYYQWESENQVESWRSSNYVLNSLQSCSLNTFDPSHSAAVWPITWQRVKLCSYKTTHPLVRLQ